MTTAEKERAAAVASATFVPCAVCDSREATLTVQRFEGRVTEELCQRCFDDPKRVEKWVDPRPVFSYMRGYYTRDIG